MFNMKLDHSFIFLTILKFDNHTAGLDRNYSFIDACHIEENKEPRSN